MNRQEIFDKVAVHLLTQNKRSIGPGGVCKYRSKDGSKCAIGCLIPDELYDSTIEYLPVESEVVARALRSAGVLDWRTKYRDNDIAFLKCLQQVHDASQPSQFAARLRDVALGYQLHSDVLDQFQETIT